MAVSELGLFGKGLRFRFMKTTARIVSLLAMIFVVSCATIPPAGIVGRWEEVGTSTVGVFHEDGTVELTTGQSQASGTYRFIGPGKLRIQLAGNDGKPARPHVFTVVISGDQMTWTDVDGVSSEYRRVK